VLTYYRRRRGQITASWKRMESACLRVLEKLRRLAPEEVSRQYNRCRAGQYRYFARLAYESGERWTGVRLLVIGMCWAPLALLKDRRTWVVATAVLANWVLPGSCCRWLERLVCGLSTRVFALRRHSPADFARPTTTTTLIQRAGESPAHDA